MTAAVQQHDAPGTGDVLGEIDGVLFIVGSRTVVSDPHLIRFRDRDCDGRLLADIGYSPAQALRIGQMLTRLALQRDPSLRGTVTPVSDKSGVGP